MAAVLVPVPLIGALMAIGTESCTSLGLDQGLEALAYQLGHAAKQAHGRQAAHAATPLADCPQCCFDAMTL